MKKFFLIIVFISTNAISQSNVLQNNVSYNYIQLRDELKSRENSLSNSIEIEGSPYWEEEFKRGKIESDNHDDINVYLRYNARKEQIEIKSDIKDNEIFVLPRNNKVEYDLNDYSYEYGLIETRSKNYIRGYLMHIFDSDAVKFVSKIRAEIQPGKVAETSYDRSTPAQFNLIQDYYISVDGNLYHEVQIKEKDFRKIFKSDRMKEYFKNHKIKEEKDVVSMLKFYADTNS